MKKLYCKICCFISSKIKDHVKDIKFRTFTGFIYSSCEPKRCWNCYNDKFKSKTLDSHDGYLPLESTNICTKCNKENGYWAYGHWMP